MGRTIDVFHGSTSRERSSQVLGLLITVVFLALAAAPYPPLTPEDEGWSYSGDLWYLRVMAVVIALTGVRGALSLGRPAPVQTLAIGPDAIRFADGKGFERTIARAEVRSATTDGLWLEFEPVSDPVQELYVVVFHHDQLQAALHRHGWSSGVAQPRY